MATHVDEPTAAIPATLGLDAICASEASFRSSCLKEEENRKCRSLFCVLSRPAAVYLSLPGLPIERGSEPVARARAPPGACCLATRRARGAMQGETGRSFWVKIQNLVEIQIKMLTSFFTWHLAALALIYRDFLLK